MGIVVAIATVLGGIAAIWFLWEKLRPHPVAMPVDTKRTPSRSGLHARLIGERADSVSIAVLYDLLDDMEKRTRRLIGWHERREPNTPYEQVGLEEGEVEHLEGLVQDVCRETLGIEKPPPTVWEPSSISCARRAAGVSKRCRKPAPARRLCGRHLPASQMPWLSSCLMKVTS